MSGIAYHGWTHRPKISGGTDPLLPGTVIYHIKVTPDEFLATSAIETGDDQFIWTAPQDIDGYILTDVEASITTVSSSGIVQVQLRNLTATHDFLSTPVQIDAGDFHSNDSGTQPVVNTANDDIAHEDRIGIDIDAAGTGAYGLEVVLTLNPGS